MGIIEPVKKGFKVATGSMDLVAVLFIFGAIFNIINIFFTANVQAGTTPDVRTSTISIGVGLIFVLLSIFVQAGSLGYVRDKIKAGQASLSAFVSAGGKYYVRLLLVGLLIVLIILAFVLVGALAVAALGAALSAVGIGIAIILAAAGIYIIMLMFLAPYVVVVAEEKVMASLKQSISLVRKNLLTVLGIMVVLIAIGFAIGLVLGIVLALLSAAVKGTASQIIFGIVSSFVNAYLGVLVTSSFMHFYLNIAGNTANTSGATS